MHQFNQLYRVYMESTRRDFIKQFTGANASTKPKTTASHCSKDAQSISLLYEQLVKTPAAPAPQPMVQQQQQQQQPAAPQQQQPANAPAFALRTFGDIKAIINRVKNKQKVAGVAAAGADAAIDAALNMIPGLGAAKSVLAFFKATTSRPDTQKTNNFIDQLDVDDSMSKIVDDTVENEFLESIETIISKYPDNEPLPANWNMTNELVKFLRNKYKNSPAVQQHLTDITARMQPAAPIR